MQFFLPRVVDLITGGWGNEVQGASDSAAEPQQNLENSPTGDQSAHFLLWWHGSDLEFGSKTLVHWDLTRSIHSCSLQVTVLWKVQKKYPSLHVVVPLIRNKYMFCWCFEMERNPIFSSQEKSNMLNIRDGYTLGIALWVLFGLSQATWSPLQPSLLAGIIAGQAGLVPQWSFKNPI